MIFSDGDASVARAHDEDFDADGIDDVFPIADAMGENCQQNGVPDSCDIVDETNPDANREE